MKLFIKLFSIAFLLGLLFLAGFIIWGAQFEGWAAEYESHLNSAKPWAWMGAIGLFMSDLVLPIPGTVLLSALGAVYGTLLGGLIGLTGYLLAALLGYGLAYKFGKLFMNKLASKEEQQLAEEFFNRWGGLAIVLSRSMPIFPEVMSMMAGLLKMKCVPFVFSVLIGTTPIAFLFAWIGSIAGEEPEWAMALTIGLPLVLWLIAFQVIKK